MIDIICVPYGKKQQTRALLSIMFKIKNFILPQSDELRELWVADQLKNLKKSTKIIDAGAGECYYKKYCDHLNYVSQDFGKYDGRGDGIGIQTTTRDSSKLDIVSDIVNIPVKKDSFDAALCVEVFEHIPRPLEALKELSRIIKKNGVLLLTAPFTSLTHYSPFYFYSGFSKNFYKENLPLLGFKIEEIYSYGNYFDYLSLEIARVPLILWRKWKILSLPLVLICLIALPFYALLRFLSLILPSSNNLLCFGLCIRAIKEK